MRYPALDVSGASGDLLLARLDDFAPSALEETDDRFTIYFNRLADRDAAHRAISQEFPLAVVTPREVDDEDWARRSQENLQAVTVGRLTVTPPWLATRQPQAPSPESPASSLQLIILPSMGFGTGHHATTRLCLAALQTLELTGKTIVDVGTGSGVLAFAGRLLGAAQAIGIDSDEDAIQSAEENLDLNPSLDGVRFAALDLRERALPPCDVVTANLTGAVLAQNAQHLLSSLAPGGTLIVSGLQQHERDDIVRAFGAADLGWERSEEGWVALLFNARAPGPV